MVNKKIKFIKELKRVGTSLSVFLPPNKLNNFGFVEGDLVEVILRKVNPNDEQEKLESAIIELAEKNQFDEFMFFGRKENEEEIKLS